MAKITKTLSAKVDKQTGKTEILFRFVGSSTIILRAKSGIYINPKTWNPKTKNLKTATFGKEEADIKKRLDDLCNAIIDTFTITNKEQVNKEWLETVIGKFHYPEKYEIKDEISQQTFFELFDDFLSVRKLSDVRKKNFRVIGRALQRYEIYTRKAGQNKFTLHIDTVTPETLRDIEKFLKEEHQIFQTHPEIYEAIPEVRTPQPRGQNTISDIFTKLRTFFLWCVEEGKTQNNPFHKFAVEECVYGTPFYISIDERNKLYNTDLSHRPQLAIQRDIFVFQCLIGCRVGDLYKMTANNVIDGAIEYVPRKTKDGRPVTVQVPLNNTANEILNRYKNGDGQKLLPFISEQKYNVAIKEMFREAGITRNVTVRNPTTGESEIRPINEIASSHLARRAFVGNLYKQVKDPNLVGALSGHKDGSKAFARYRDIDIDTKRELIESLEKGKETNTQKQLIELLKKNADVDVMSLFVELLKKGGQK